MAYKFQRGEAILSGALLQEGNIEIESGFEFAMHDVTVLDTSRNLTVAGLSGSGALQVGGAATIAGAADFNSTSDFEGAMNLQAGITIAGAADLNGALDVAGATSLAASGVETDIRGTLSVDEAAVFDSTIQVDGAADFNSTSDFQGAMNLQAGITVAGAADLNGALDVAGATSLAATGVLTDIRGTLSVDEAAVFDSTIQVAGAADLNGALDVAGAASLAASGVETDIRGTLSVDEAAVFDSTVQIDDALDVNAAADIQGALNLQAGITVAGAADLNGDLDVDGQTDLDVLNVAEVASFAADITASAGVHIDGGLVANSAIVEDLTSGRVVLAGTGGELEDSGNLTFDGSELLVAGAISGSGNLQAGGHVRFDGAGDETIDVAADSLYFFDASDNSLMKRDTVVDFVALIAGAGLAASSGQLSVQGSSVADVTNSSTLSEGYNYFTGSVPAGASYSVTLPSGPSAGDIVHVKAKGIGDGASIEIARAGSQTIDGETSIFLESPYAAVSLVYVASDDWRIV